jgi:ADP-ribose pyrophosphatase
MHAPVTSVEILSDETVGREGGFLAIRRLRMVNVRADGTRSTPYLVDFLQRPKGIDAVVVAVYHRSEGRRRVLIRAGLRPALHVGRPASELPLPDLRPYLFFREVVAGIVEGEDRGEAGLRARAALEVLEEVGFDVRPESVELLGAGTFPSPGSMPEKFWLCAVEISDPAAARPPEGDGSPMEEGSTMAWMDLDEAIAACVRGDLEDAKTELALRRLRERP